MHNDSLSTSKNMYTLMHTCRLLEKHPVPLSLYNKCIRVEKTVAAASNIDRIRELFEAALREYGSSQPGQWVLVYMYIEVVNLRERQWQIQDPSEVES